MQRISVFSSKAEPTVPVEGNTKVCQASCSDAEYADSFENYSDSEESFVAPKETYEGEGKSLGNFVQAHTPDTFVAQPLTFALKFDPPAIAMQYVDMMHHPVESTRTCVVQLRNILRSSKPAEVYDRVESLLNRGIGDKCGLSVEKGQLWRLVHRLIDNSLPEASTFGDFNVCVGGGSSEPQALSRKSTEASERSEEEMIDGVKPSHLLHASGGIFSRPMFELEAFRARVCIVRIQQWWRQVYMLRRAGRADVSISDIAFSAVEMNAGNNAELHNLKHEHLREKLPTQIMSSLCESHSSVEKTSQNEAAKISSDSPNLKSKDDLSCLSTTYEHKGATTTSSEPFQTVSDACVPILSQGSRSSESEINRQGPHNSRCKSLPKSKSMLNDVVQFLELVLKRQKGASRKQEVFREALLEEIRMSFGEIMQRIDIFGKECAAASLECNNNSPLPASNDYDAQSYKSMASSSASDTGSPLAAKSQSADSNLEELMYRVMGEITSSKIAFKQDLNSLRADFVQSMLALKEKYFARQEGKVDGFAHTPETFLSARDDVKNVNVAKSESGDAIETSCHMREHTANIHGTTITSVNSPPSDARSDMHESYLTQPDKSNTKTDPNNIDMSTGATHYGISSPDILLETEEAEDGTAKTFALVSGADSEGQQIFSGYKTVRYSNEKGMTLLNFKQMCSDATYLRSMNSSQYSTDKSATSTVDFLSHVTNLTTLSTKIDDICDRIENLSSGLDAGNSQMTGVWNHIRCGDDASFQGLKTNQNDGSSEQYCGVVLSKILYSQSDSFPNNNSTLNASQRSNVSHFRNTFSDLRQRIQGNLRLL
jgi:hypothetical protein